jgi:L,D-transpeptidase ErfK/SrfK
VIAAICAGLTVGVGAAQTSNSLLHEPIGHAIVGGDQEFTVERGNTLSEIAGYFGVDVRTIAAMNHIRVNSRIRPGQKLFIDNRHIVPFELHDGIILNLPQRMLFFFKNGKLFGAYPAAVGRPSWPTPQRAFSVLEMREHPVWRVPVSIQDEMRRNGWEVQTRVPPGPDNPLGDYFIGLSIPGYGIHSTNAPESIYTFGTHGCIRLHPDDAEQLFKNVKIGDRGEIIYEPYLLARLPDGKVFLEVHRDIYGKRGPALAAVKVIASSNHLENLIDWRRAAEVAARAEGIAREVTAASNLSGGGAR